MNTFTRYQDAVLTKWSLQNMHQFYNRQENSELFTFIDGPPFINSNSLHIGHCAISSIKSSMLTYKSMIGHKCLNKLGYDCHGLPIESIAIKELGCEALEALEKIGIAKFNAFCKEKISQFEGGWEPIYIRLGRWLDFDNSYKTMDKNFMESVWWAFAELYKKGLVYRGYKITPYSYPLQSPLSNFEASQNYKEVDCRSAYVRFKAHSNPNILIKLSLYYDIAVKDIYFIAWTTTPWTLPANLALCVNSKLEYDVIFLESQDIYILGKDTAKNAGITIDGIHTKVVVTILGKDLLGMEYEPLFPTYSNLQPPNEQDKTSKWFSILADDYVKPVDGGTGTSIVHLAPVFGEDDYRVCREQGLITESIIPQLEIIDAECKYLFCKPSKDGLLNIDAKYHGKLAFDTETDIIKDLKVNQTLVKIQQIRHEYPYCYRTDTPLIYRTCESFYIDIQKIKTRMIELNKTIHWYPEHIGTQRFHNWLDTAKDWCISRSRYFGTPIPVWISDDDINIKVISSIAELEILTGRAFTDIHPEFVNNATFTINNKRYTRVMDIFDCWFESGSVPFAQYHYPFEPIPGNGDITADFIVEGLDQTRGWFYTLLVLSTSLFDKAPAKNIMTVGLILDEHKKKISKKSKNFVDPLILIENYGADAIRLYLLQSQITNAEPLPFKEEEVKILNKELIQFKNTLDFLVEHMTHLVYHKLTFNLEAYLNTNNSMDKWIILSLNNATQQICNFMGEYQIAKAVRTILEMIENITNWYLKFNRDRLKGKLGNEEWLISLSVLFQVIKKFVVLLAPFAPFITTWIYDDLSKLVPNQLKDSVHLEDITNLILLDINLEQSKECLDTFALLKRVSRMIRSARMCTTTHTSSKTPIRSCVICMDSPKQLDMIASCIDFIQTELNILDITYSPLQCNINYKILPNKAVLGKKYKKQAIELYKLVENLPITSIDEHKRIKLLLNDNEILITTLEYTLEPIFQEHDIYDLSTNPDQGNILAKVDFTYDADIEKLAILKQFIAEIQQTRKHMGLRPWNKISIEISQDNFQVVNNNVEYMKQRLECEVNSKSEIISNRTFKPYEDDSRIISYNILIL
jgi:isoleucyl-tRNA synthetase